MNDPFNGESNAIPKEIRQLFPYFIKVFSIPIVLLAAYFFVRLFNFQPIIEIDGFSTLIRVLFLMFGISVAYFVYMVQLSLPLDTSATVKTHFWELSSIFLLLILFDDVLMLHEQFYLAFGVSDKVPLIAYGGLLGATLLYYRTRFFHAFWFFIGLFGVLAASAILLDNTGIEWRVGGRHIDLEQILEVFALLVLSSAYAAQALHELHQIFLRK